MNVFVLYAATVLVWGVSWYLVKFQVNDVSPAVSVAYRFWIAAALMMVWVLLRRQARLPGRDHPWVALQGLFLFCTNFLLFYFAAQHVTTGLLAVAFSSASLFVPLLNWAIRGQRLDFRMLLAAVIGVAGLLLVFWPEVRSFKLSDSGTIGLLLSLAGTLSFSFGSIINARNQVHGIPVLTGTAWGMTYGASFLTLFALLMGYSFSFPLSMAYVGSLLYLATGASVVAFGCYLTLVARVGAGNAAYATVLFPIVALAISTVLESYQWRLLAIVGVAMVLGGNLVALSAGARKKPVLSSG